MNNLILTGSTLWFADIPGFVPGDTDYIKIVDNPIGFNFVKQTGRTRTCYFEWKRMSPQEYIDYALSRGPAMQLGKFLTPEFVAEVGFTIEHLKQLKPLTDKLGPKHAYEKIIFESYIENNAFTLTQAQKLKAFEEYKKARQQ